MKPRVVSVMVAGTRCPPHVPASRTGPGPPLICRENKRSSSQLPPPRSLPPAHVILSWAPPPSVAETLQSVHPVVGLPQSQGDRDNEEEVLPSSQAVLTAAEAPAGAASEIRPPASKCGLRRSSRLGMSGLAAEQVGWPLVGDLGRDLGHAKWATFRVQ